MRSVLTVFLLVILSGLAQADPARLTPLSNPRLPSDFKLQDTQGNTHTLAGYRGRVLVVNFWATWCPPCIKEMPSLQRAWEQLRQEPVQILAVNAGEGQTEIDSFSKNLSVDFPLLIDSDMALTSAWSVKGLPTTYILDPSGHIVFQALGDLHWDDPDIIQKLRSLLPKNQ